MVGLTLGLVWTRCVGPVLAGIMTLALSGTGTALAAAITWSTRWGVSVPMLAMMRGGRTLLGRIPALSNNLAGLQRASSIVLACFAVGMLFGLNRRFQTFTVEWVPYVQNLTLLEDSPQVQQQIHQDLR